MAERAMLRGYVTSIDRAGLALAAGAALGGLFTAVLVLFGPSPSPFGFVIGFLIGAVITAAAAIAVGGPLWLIAHASGRRGPRAAGLIGALSGFALFLGGQTYGFSLFAMPAMDARTLMFRWFSAAATSLILALVSAAIALMMWRVAYRRI